MAAERLSMRQVKEILRQKWVLKRSHREIAESVGVSAGSVGKMATRATRAGLTWEQVEGLKFPFHIYQFDDHGNTLYSFIPDRSGLVRHFGAIGGRTR